MMYVFRDTDEYTVDLGLPAEAMKINGEYIEKKVNGYRTLYVKGRGILAPELGTYETGVRDGSTLKSKRYPARTITVGYQLIAQTDAAFRSAYNILNTILDVEEAEIIFNDEPDKFFIGTPSAAEEVAPGSNAVTGEFEILCVDPFKYSTTEYEVSPTLDDGTTFGIDYHGTYRSYPILEAAFPDEDEDNGLTGNGDCGYVAFFNDQEKIIQMGDPDEPDTESLPKSQTLVNQTFTGYGSSVAGRWPLNVGTTSSDNSIQTGTVTAAADDSSKKTKMLQAASYGSGKAFHGPSITRVIPADKGGEVGATQFRMTWKQRLCIGKTKSASQQRGAFQLHLVNRTGGKRLIVAGISIFKKSAGNKATMRFYVNGKERYKATIDLTRYNKRFGYAKTITTTTKKRGKIIKTKKLIQAVLTSCIQKSGSKVLFDIGGTKKSYRDSSISSIPVHEISIVFGKYSDKPALSDNGLYWAKFVKDGCDAYRDIPNKFSAGDVVTADCSDGEIRLNNSPTPALGALGNDWEEFYLEPGSNQIGVSWSDWVPAGSEPTCKIHYREVFL